jgi:hypothetical protein
MPMAGKVPARPELVFKRFEGQNFLSRVNRRLRDIERELPLTTSMMSKEHQVAAATVTVPLMAER